jgi:hypothetical protein
MRRQWTPRIEVRAEGGAVVHKVQEHFAFDLMPSAMSRQPFPLLILTRLLIVYQPVSLALSASAALQSLSIRGSPLAAAIVVRVAVTALCVAAGLALTNRHSGAVALARAALVASAACDVFVYTTPYFPTNLPPGDAPLYVAGSLVYHTGWLLYLLRSRRVRAYLMDERPVTTTDTTDTTLRR